MEDKLENQQKNPLTKGDMVSFAFELGFIIALPVIFFGYLGKWLDGKTDTYPLLTLIGIFAAIAFTSVWIYRKFRSYFK